MNRVLDDRVGSEPDLPTRAADALHELGLLARQETRPVASEPRRERLLARQCCSTKRDVGTERPLGTRTGLARHRAEARDSGELEEPIGEPAGTVRPDEHGDAGTADTTHGEITLERRQER